MARQNVGSPKFYIDMFSYNMHMGNIDSVGFEGDFTGQVQWADIYSSAIGLNPTNQFRMTTADYNFLDDGQSSMTKNFMIEFHEPITLPDIRTSADKYFIGILGHRLETLNANIDPEISLYNESGEIVSNEITLNELCNFEGGFNYNGWSLANFNMALEKIKAVGFKFRSSGGMSQIFEMGSFCFGHVFNMPISPDLKLTMTREYDGIKSQQSKGGATLTQSHYSSPSKWGQAPAWELWSGDSYDKKIINSRGRRSWELNFSYIDGDDLFAINETSSTTNPTSIDTYTDAGYNHTTDFDSDGNFMESFENSNSFITKLISFTGGGVLPFIFQPDGLNAAPDQFAICRLDMGSIKFKQEAHNVYNVKLKIRESW